MYTVREFAKKRVNSGVFARFVLFLSGIPSKQKSKDFSSLQLTVGITFKPLLCQNAPHQRFLKTLSICRARGILVKSEKSGDKTQ